MILDDPARNKYDEHWKAGVSLRPGELFGVAPIPLLCDFGLSVDLRNAKTMNIGTHGYQAPVGSKSFIFNLESNHVNLKRKSLSRRNDQTALRRNGKRVVISSL